MTQAPLHLLTVFTGKQSVLLWVLRCLKSRCTLLFGARVIYDETLCADGALCYSLAVIMSNSSVCGGRDPEVHGSKCEVEQFFLSG